MSLSDIRINTESHRTRINLTYMAFTRAQMVTAAHTFAISMGYLEKKNEIGANMITSQIILCNVE